ncbi:MipA/OmpV family protein [Rheinheimera sp. YQF-2]|uniref:MipA/OmpV family protein n=1 Tax=Rheinheimera lutimaris TaxID=2740584 RepID=A0A7Y5ASH5_9GAMM|nr:MipA/OmpV family protein [Rheinheimera lutimaris]NRQ43131.1 MipA/OmpV family protein [Rheinheimera lutimaris]
MTLFYRSAVAAATLICLPLSAEQPALPLWEAGVVGINVNQLAYPGSDQLVRRNFVLPYLVYRGDILRADRDNVGLRAFKTDSLELDVGFAGSLGSSDTDIAVRDGMKNLGTLIEAGPRLRWTLSEDVFGARVRADFPLRAVFDLSNSLNYNGVSFEPGLYADITTAKGTFYALGASAVFGSEKLSDYFYQVSAADVTPNRPLFNAQGGLIALRGSVSVGKRFTPKWRGFGFGRYESTQGAKNADSPLLVERSGWSFGVGVTYIWAESAQKVAY